MTVPSDLAKPPCVAFALRFGNADGFVQQFFARQRDLVSRELDGAARCLLVFKELGDNPDYPPRWAAEAQTDFYDYSGANRERIRCFVHENNVVLVVFQSADIGEVDLPFLHEIGVRTISTEDNSFDHTRTQSFARAAAKFLARRVLKLRVHDLHIANTHGQYDFLQRFAYLPRQRLRIIPYGIDTEFYHPGDRAAACARLGLDPNTIWIMAASQSRPEKRVDLLMDAVRRVTEARPDISIGLFYVGDGWMLPEWRESARKLLPATDYRFFGKQTDMRSFYQAASIFIHGASKESFGLVLVEAMASGLPIVATRAHGPSEIIVDGSTGYLVDRDDWDTFVSAVLSYVDQPDRRRDHGDMGRRRCLEHYTHDREASELASLIRPFLGQVSGVAGQGPPARHDEPASPSA
jgi:glycosyltransferase involved in cell wall biosynthesis